MDCYGNNDYRDYLAHHGILGQKWGKRNGPPYPLGVSDHSASEKKAGWKRSLYSGLGRVKKSTTVKIEKSDGYQRGLKIKSKNSTIQEDLRAINPKGYQTNCMYCTIAFEMRRRGYDVEANGVAATGLSSDVNQKVFPKSKVSVCYPINSISKAQRLVASKEGNTIVEEKLSKELKKQGVGARGNMMIRLSAYGGHSVAYEVTNKGYKFFDAQQGVEYDEDKSRDFIRHSLGAEYARYDKLDFNDKAVLSAVKNREKR